MVYRLIIVLFFFSVGAFAQDNFIKHKISQGDNLSVIAKKYGVKVKDIADANPNAPRILKLNSTLLIPNKNKTAAKTKNKNVEVADNNTSSIAASGTHEVASKETLWGISKKYNVSVDDLKKANPSLESEGLKIGQQINIPSNNVASNISSPSDASVSSEVVSTDVEFIREVKTKETKYGISKEYGITVAELVRQNPSIKGKVPVGYLLKIRVPKEKADAIQAAKTLQETNLQTDASSSQVAETAPEIKRDSTVVRTGDYSGLIDQLIASATENIGIRYRSGGTTKAGFDCSGLMFCTFGNFDIKLPRSSIEQSRIGTKVASDEAQKGDLIFFRTNGRRHINHVGMVVENVDGEIKFVHSSTHGGVMISSTKEPYYTRAFSQVNRVLN
ncbi:peptidoglycan endopeptidase [Flavobacterium nitrogenifigens]|uniref:Cell wall-associated hydrolase, NlpC family n=1 Tax=Flavobacterium nitrogenifigens TaxID=1617283 RepID=A0A521ES51_9FLAO|nr:peptidoglycan endopeptidase [Flavobacterium nitrogenifigens]KAF2338760.1 LysM peptidoglycan-binding domain-containing protein [Flavobacterium nitrogenifigens]SMO86756.1 Cell wall-associated hydrolase, NlpC family [Flavobacterium nitrogenifigens]